ncbi:P-loop NTPase family protein [Tenacibaculum piscium]|uniref:hypothetical protein n=1 Tax=Tenacibaculum piscium TaxID=1458515 RepID=UPI001F1603E7|nr:hypothetical protein [Tenacibaculum piscium]
MENTIETSNQIPKEILWEEFQEASKIILAGRKFDETIQYEKILKTVLRYFSGDENFNEEGIIQKANLNKGLLIIGNSKCVAKTVLLQIIQKAGYEIYQKYGFERAFFSMSYASVFVNAYEFSKNSLRHDFDLTKAKLNPFLITDFGSEDLAFNDYELIGEILESRYLSKAKTFITTDLSMLEISKRYGRKLAENIQEMCNIINWN